MSWWVRGCGRAASQPDPLCARILKYEIGTARPMVQLYYGFTVTRGGRRSAQVERDVPFGARSAASLMTHHFLFKLHLWLLRLS